MNHKINNVKKFLLNKILEFKIAFDREKRYNNKIYVNKKGPVFDFKKDDFMSRKNDKSESSPKKNINSKSSATLLQEEIRKRKIKEMNFQQIGGISFGLKHSMDSDFKELRRIKNLNIKKSLDNIFDIENVAGGRSPYKKYKRSNSNRSIRELVIEKKENMKLMRVAKREKKLLRVKNKLDNLTIEKEKRNDAIKAKYQIDTYHNQSLSRSKIIKNGKYGISGDNFSDEEDAENNPEMLDESYISEHGVELDRKTKFLNDRYNIETHKKRRRSKQKRETEITPGPGYFKFFF